MHQGSGGPPESSIQLVNQSFSQLFEFVFKIWCQICFLLWGRHDLYFLNRYRHFLRRFCFYKTPDWQWTASCGPTYKLQKTKRIFSSFASLFTNKCWSFSGGNKWWSSAQHLDLGDLSSKIQMPWRSFVAFFGTWKPSWLKPCSSHAWNSLGGPTENLKSG